MSSSHAPQSGPAQGAASCPPPAQQLILEFSGWCLIRLPTDPDPPDEPRGISGYTFAFAGEPDLDRSIHLQKPDDFEPRSFGPAIGVSVNRAVCIGPDGERTIGALCDAAVDLLDGPELQNRNWVLTLPGLEPIDPFHLLVTGKGISLRRSAPIDPAHPDTPIWELDQALILSHGARGLEFEPDTVGRATGVWNGLQYVTERRDRLQAELDRLQREGGDPVKITALQGRIYELDLGIASPNDRRVMTRYFVERFGYPMAGDAEVTGDQQAILGGTLDTTCPWTINFWLGGWDPDSLCAWMQGSLSVPYAAQTAGADGMKGALRSG
jgi:hypothetical protein